MITVNDIITPLNSYIGDTSTDRISATERLEYVTEAVVWLQETLQNDAQNATYALDYYDTVNYYQVTNSIGDLLEGADLRRSKDKQVYSFEHKSSRELAEDIGSGFTGDSWTVERRDNQTYLVINHKSQFNARVIDNFDQIDGWSVDSTNSDATNLTIDTNEFKTSSASFNFDISVSQSVSNKATIKTGTHLFEDLSSLEDTSAWVFWLFIPDVTFFNSVTFYWGSFSTTYWSATATSTLDGGTFVNGWNRVKIPWSGAVKTGTPNVTKIDYFQFDINYAAGQQDMNNIRIDNLMIAKAEPLKFFYLSWNVGKDINGTDLTAFGTTTDVPYFSGTYDQYKYPVAHKAASLVFMGLRLKSEMDSEVVEAERSLHRSNQMIPSQKNPQTKNFKIRGINLTKNRLH